MSAITSGPAQLGCLSFRGRLLGPTEPSHCFPAVPGPRSGARRCPRSTVGTWAPQVSSLSQTTAADIQYRSALSNSSPRNQYKYHFVIISASDDVHCVEIEFLNNMNDNTIISDDMCSARTMGAVTSTLYRQSLQAVERVPAAAGEAVMRTWTPPGGRSHLRFGSSSKCRLPLR
jgi:hypothetical protein